MNATHTKIVLGVALALFLLTLCNAPWKRIESNPYRLKIEYAPLWAPPVGWGSAHDVNLMAVPLAFEWIGILVLTAGVCYAFRKS